MEETRPGLIRRESFREMLSGAAPIDISPFGTNRATIDAVDSVILMRHMHGYSRTPAPVTGCEHTKCDDTRRSEKRFHWRKERPPSHDERPVHEKLI